MTQWLWKLRQRYYRWLMQRDAVLRGIDAQIAVARRRHSPVTYLYRAYAQRVNQLLGAGR